VDGTDAVGFRNVPVNSQSAAYTLVLADSGKVILHPSSDANARTFTIPANSSVAYPIGTKLNVAQFGAGTTTISAVTPGTTTIVSAGATVAAPYTRVQYSAATCIKTGTDTWFVLGDIR
jgi:ferric-dicitrate binding protein FerR (iron transport regulator)